MKINNICCIGGDILGRTMCFAIAFKCPEVRVIVLDDEKTVSEWNSDTLPFRGPDIDHIVKKCRHRNLFFSSFYEFAIKDADMIFLSVKVPIKTVVGRKQTLVDFKELESVTKLIALYSESDKILVEKSDVPVKAVEKISSILQSSCVISFRYQILSIPCFLTEKSSMEDILNPERIAIGCQSNPSGRAAAQSVCELYESWIPRKNIIILNHWSAGLYKLVTNSFLAQRECSLNSLVTICEESGGDSFKILNALCQDPETGSTYVKPFIGLEEFQEDISKLVFMCELLKLNEMADYWQAVLDLNRSFVWRFIDKIKYALRSISSRDITVWGFSFLESDFVENKSPTVTVCEWLMKENFNIRMYDPEINESTILKKLGLENVDEKERNIQVYNDLYMSINNSSALIICTEREEFTHVEFSKLEKWMKQPIIIDGYHLFDIKVLSKFGIQYYTTGLKIKS